MLHALGLVLIFIRIRNRIWRCLICPTLWFLQ